MLAACTQSAVNVGLDTPLHAEMGPEITVPACVWTHGSPEAVAEGRAAIEAAMGRYGITPDWRERGAWEGPLSLLGWAHAVGHAKDQRYARLRDESLPAPRVSRDTAPIPVPYRLDEPPECRDAWLVWVIDYDLEARKEFVMEAAALYVLSQGVLVPLGVGGAAWPHVAMLVYVDSDIGSTQGNALEEVTHLLGCLEYEPVMQLDRMQPAPIPTWFEQCDPQIAEYKRWLLEQGHGTRVAQRPGAAS